MFYIDFSNPGQWSLYQVKMDLIQRPKLSLATSKPLTDAGRKTQCVSTTYLVTRLLKGATESEVPRTISRSHLSLLKSLLALCQ